MRGVLVMAPETRAAMIDLLAKLGRSFRNARVAAGERQQDASARLGVTKTIVSNFERGVSGNVTIGNVLRLFDLYGLTLVALPKDSPLCPPTPAPIRWRGTPRHLYRAAYLDSHHATAHAAHADRCGVSSHEEQ